MPVPLILLFVMLIKGLTLDGAWKGIKAYWDFYNWYYLSDSGIWNAAIDQYFFSLSVCMGVMTAYGMTTHVTGTYIPCTKAKYFISFKLNIFVPK